jgi:Tol biopolymer transport system component
MEREPAPLDLHPPLGRVIRTCLAKDPDQRFQTAVDLKRALAWAMEQQPATTARPARWYWIAMAAAIAITAFGGWALWRSRQITSEAPVFRFAVTPPEGGHFDSGSLAVSPDGRTLAFVETVQGKRGLWIRPLDGTASRLLSGTDFAYFPFWSPDSRSIAYFAADKLWRVDVAGGAPLAICDSGVARGGTWSGDGAIVFASIGSGLLRVSAAGGTPAPLTVPDAAQGETNHSWPQVLSRGRLLYVVLSSKEEHTGIYASTLDQPEQRIRLIAGPSHALYAAGHLLWLRGSTLVAQRFDPERLQLSGDPQPVADPIGGSFGSGKMTLAASPGGVLFYDSAAASMQLTWFDKEGKRLGTLGEPGAYISFGLSPDGRRAVVTRRGSTGSDLWMVEIGRGAWSRFTFTPGVNASPVWSPDGRTVVFRSESPFNLYRKEASGAGTEQRITKSANLQVPTDWSRDGRLLLFFEMAPETKRDVWVLPVTAEGKPEAGAQPRPYLRTRFNELLARFSPEPHPRWVAYVSDESGRDEVYLQAFPEPRGKWPISTGGGRYPRWSPDGRELYYLAPDDKLMVVNLKLGADSVEASAPRGMFTVRWDLSALASPYEVTPDGQRFLVRAPTETGSQMLQVIVNGPALLKKETGAK